MKKEKQYGIKRMPAGAGPKKGKKAFIAALARAKKMTDEGKGVVLKNEKKRVPKVLNLVHPGGADIFVNKFSGPGDAPPTATIKDLGGLRFSNVKVNLIFWGGYWSAPAGSGVTMSQVINDCASILSGPYISSLSQYGVYSAHLGDIFVTNAGDEPPTNYDDGTIADFILSVIRGGSLPEPDEENEYNIHCVFMPPGTNPPVGLLGEHSQAFYFDIDFLDADLWDASHFAFISFNSRSEISRIFSHELVEALTDPEGDAIQMIPVNDSSWNEIADHCRSRAGLNGVTVQSYWSEKDKSCVIPVEVQVEMEITCIHKIPRDDPYHHIISVGGIDRTRNVPFNLKLNDVINLLDRGTHFYVSGVNGQKTHVAAYAHIPPSGIIKRYIRTEFNGTPVDNLLSLPECS